jgi:hypothetical protein
MLSGLRFTLKGYAVKAGGQGLVDSCVETVEFL